MTTTPSPEATAIANAAVNFNVNPSVASAEFSEALASHAHNVAADIDAAILAAKRAQAVADCEAACIGCAAPSWDLRHDFHHHREGEAPAFQCRALNIRAAWLKAHPGEALE